MKAAAFDYEKPMDLAALFDLLAEDSRDVQLLAGGQSLMPMMNFRLAQPELLVDLNGLSELSFIEEHNDHIRIGAMTRYAELEASDVVATHLPLIKRALPYIAHAAVRNRGTIGGSSALADPAAEMPALLTTLGAQLHLQGKQGSRVVAAQDFFLGMFDTALEEGEIVHSITVPKAGDGQAFGFYELARRHGDYAMAGVAIAASSVDPVRDMRVVMFSVSDKASLMTGAGEAMQGHRLDDEAAVTAACESIAGFDFHGDLNADASVKRHLAKIVFKRALEGMNR